MNFLATILGWLTLISVGATVLAFFMDHLEEEGEEAGTEHIDSGRVGVDTARPL